MRKKGVDTIACVSVNDPFVLRAWSKSLECESEILMLADGNAAFAESVGLDFDTGGFGGIRCKRMSMLVDDGKITKLFVEDGGKFTEGPEPGSSAEFMLTQI